MRRKNFDLVCPPRAFELIYFHSRRVLRRICAFTYQFAQTLRTPRTLLRKQSCLRGNSREKMYNATATVRRKGGGYTCRNFYAYQRGPSALANDLSRRIPLDRSRLARQPSIQLLLLLLGTLFSRHQDEYTTSNGHLLSHSDSRA